ncbi:MAG: hypothetical protein JWM09_1359 [Francisellaceae bacterium]|nr:hypothetical protein [Francisellaceae bacterium]
MEFKEIALDDILEIIGDEVGKRYSWFLIDVEAIGYDVDNKEIWEDLIWGNICDQCDNDKYYEIDWKYLKKIAPKIRTVTSFIFYGCKDKDKYLKEMQKALKQEKNYPECELKFEIYDSEIWDIKGTDIILVERLKKYFSPLPIMVI